MTLNVPASVRAAIDDPNGQAPCPPLDDVIAAADSEGGGVLVYLGPYQGELLARAIGRLQAERDWPGDAATMNGTPTGEEIRRVGLRETLRGHWQQNHPGGEPFPPDVDAQL